MEVDLDWKRTLSALLLLVTVASCAGRPAAPLPTDTATPDTQPTATIASTATPTAQAAPTWTPGPSPAPSATPTATAEPTSEPVAQATREPEAAAASAGTTDPLAQGRWLQIIGDCDQARRTFAELLAAGLTPAHASEARYRMAECYERDAAYAEAWATLAELLATAPANDPYRAPAQFLLGEALTALASWPAAEAAYAAYLPLAPELAYLTHQRIGAARQAQGDLAAATEAYRAALAVSPDWTNTVAIRRALANLALEQADFAGAVAQYDALRGDETKGAWAAEMYYLAGNALARPAQLLAQAVQFLAPATVTTTATATPIPLPAEALARWQAAVDADITSRWAHAAIVALLDAGAPVDEFQRGLANYHNKVYALAIAAFDRLRAAEPAGRDGQAWHYAGLSYLALDEVGKGLAELEHFIANYPTSPLWPDAWMAKARTLANAGRTAEAATAYRSLAEQRPAAPQAPKALWQAALLTEKPGANPTAAEAYLAVARAYPAADEGWRAYQAAGLMYFRLADYRSAADTWREMAEQPQLAAFTRPVAYFWQGRAQLALGEAAAARAAWQSAVAAGPESFYGLRAAAWAVGQPDAWVREGAAVSPAEAAGQDTPEADTTEIAAWLRTWAGEGALALSPAITADADWQRGQALLALGRRTDALTQWERVRRRQADSPWSLAALALAFRDAGAHRLSLLAAEQVAAKWGGLMRDAPPALQRLAYPLPYADLIRAEAARQNLDPRLLAAIIRQESRFEGGATSVAGAQGLMQVMPGTAAGIARQMNWAGFEPQQAYWPYVNVAFGAFYVRQWLSHFGGSFFTALAAYNGGPGSATTWYNWAPEDDDLVAALITFNETRVYVQAVWTNYEAYRRLYPR